ncbi:MAG: hypothetical protein IJ751_06820 [Oscillospiraceae bacterium]|nr:hypothetical protein [Oscillospiraceae bacterium]
MKLLKFLTVLLCLTLAAAIVTSIPAVRRGTTSVNAVFPGESISVYTE